MIRGTTPVHVFNVNRDLREATVYLTYKQDNSTIITKTNADLEISENAICAVLTQQDTLKFHESGLVEVQIRFVTKEGIAEASEIIKMAVSKILKDGEIHYE